MRRVSPGSVADPSFGGWSQPVVLRHGKGVHRVGGCCMGQDVTNLVDIQHERQRYLKKLQLCPKLFRLLSECSTGVHV
jgi:hypothetical protein